MGRVDRLEDLGVAKNMLSVILDNSDEYVFEHCDSKHGFDAFSDKLNKEDGLFDHHCQLRRLRECLWEVMDVLQGEE